MYKIDLSFYNTWYTYITFARFHAPLKTFQISSQIKYKDMMTFKNEEVCTFPLPRCLPSSLSSAVGSY